MCVRQRPARELHRLSLDYLDAVADEEWPLLAHGEAGPRTSAIVDALWRISAEWEPRDATERTFQAAAVHAVDELGQRRRERLANSQPRSTPWLDVVLALGAIFVVGFTFFFGLPYRISKQVMTGALTLMIALLLFFSPLMKPPR